MQRRREFALMVGPAGGSTIGGDRLEQWRRCRSDHAARYDLMAAICRTMERHGHTPSLARSTDCDDAIARRSRSAAGFTWVDVETNSPGPE